MHPETLLAVARIEHQQRVAEATRWHQVVRALAGRIKTTRTRRDAVRVVVDTNHAPHCAQCVPRWAT